jgi:hypothetical protein
MAGKPLPIRLHRIEIAVIAFWFGNEHSEAAQIYTDAGRILKQRPLDRITPSGIRSSG